MAKNFNRPSNKMKFKLNIIVLGFLAIGFLILIARIIYIAFFAEFNGVKYGNKAYNQQLSPSKIRSHRGTIYDSHMIPLAQSITVWTVSISPNQIKNRAECKLIAKKLSEILDVDYDKIIKKCASNTKYEEIKKRVEKPQRDQILEFMKENKITSITMVEDSKRFYPLKNLAAHTIGFTGYDNQGIIGLELFYDKELKGTDGKTVSVQNGLGGPMPYEFNDYCPPIDGNSLVLSLDSTVQRYCDSVMDEVLKIRKPLNRCLAIVINIHTGEILALSVKPDFDLNDPFNLPNRELFPKILDLNKRDARDSFWRNKAISDTYEPGSVCKVVTGSAALEEGVVSLNSSFTCGGGIKVGDRTMHCWKTDASHGTQNLSQAYANSCNPAFIKIGLALGPELYSKYLNLFGLTSKTGIDLPAEANSQYYEAKDLTQVSLASESIGQSLSITPIQMLMAFCAVSNGGYLVTPHIAKQIIDKDGNVIKSNSKIVKRQVISEQTSKTMRELLEGVVKGIKGEGTNATVEGYRMGGKTGTGEKLEEKRQTGKDYYVSSIIGLITANNPKYAVMCLVDSPTTYRQYYGGQVASPIFSQIAEKITPYLGFTPTYSQEELEEFYSITPSCEKLDVEDAKNKLNLSGFKSVEIVGQNNEVLKQFPQAGSKINKSAKIVLYTDEDITKKVTVPDVVGRSQSEANKELSNHGLNISMDNITKRNRRLRVSSQTPKAGELVPKGSTVSLSFLLSNDDSTGTY